MRLKEIKQGMIIHCKTKEEMEELSKNIEFMVDVDHIWNYGNDGLRRNCISLDNDGKYLGFDTYEYFVRQGMKITEFSDLIMPELTAEEVLEICAEICEVSDCDNDCPLAAELEDSAKQCMICPKSLKTYSETIPIICEQWKYEHEKKEPEIETVDICRIIEIQPDGRKRCVHEEDMDLPFDGYERQKTEEILKRYCMEHDGNFFAVHEVVSRVKR